MGIIKKDLLIFGDKKTQKITAIFDSGADNSIIREDVANKICTINKSVRGKTALLANNTKINITGVCVITTTIEGVDVEDTVYVVDQLTCELILGTRLFQHYNIKLDFENDAIDISGAKTEILLI